MQILYHAFDFQIPSKMRIVIIVFPIFLDKMLDMKIN